MNTHDIAHQHDPKPYPWLPKIGPVVALALVAMADLGILTLWLLGDQEDDD